jgi:signal transduction histidine kinase
MAGPGGVHASVSDDGPGVPAEFRQDLLRPFSRLERSHTTPGSGLGLSLASAIVVLHDARLTLEDEGPGLRCIVTFPPSPPP